MTRKRFIKLLMSRGVQRNEAQERAKQVQRFGSYQATFTAFYLQSGYLKVDLACIADAFKNAMEEIVRKLHEFGHALPRVGIDLASGPDCTAVIRHVLQPPNGQDQTESSTGSEGGAHDPVE